MNSYTNGSDIEYLVLEECVLLSSKIFFVVETAEKLNFEEILVEAL